MERTPLEQHTRTEINIRLANLGWILNEKDPRCNVTQEHPKTEEQYEKLKGKKPDYLLYESGTDNPIGVIEAKRPGYDLDIAMEQAVIGYAKPLNIPLAFAFNDSFVTAKHVYQSRPLKIDGEELQDFIDQLTSLRFIHEGPEIYSRPKGTTYSREQLLNIFKVSDDLLREEGLRFGFERFSAFAEILFLKLIDESEKLREFRGEERTIEKRYCWNQFVQKYRGKDLIDFIGDSVWTRLRSKFGDIFDTPFSIKQKNTIDAIVDLINPINLTSTDTDVKGDAFEYFLKNVTNGFKDLGEYFTPRHIVRTMVHLVKPRFYEKIYDPFCGTGGFLLEAFKYLSLRVDPSKPEVLKTLREKTLYGNEITSTARIAKMNMVLFGDGHTNISQVDTLANPIKEAHDVILSNIPYSQKTKYGHFYPIPSIKGNSICVQHIWQALREGGRAAVIVPETLLYDKGIYKSTRELILRTAKEFTVISLPRGVFMPYTPEKTNILFFEKGRGLKKIFFFAINNDGFELNTRRKPKPGDSDMKVLLSNIDNPGKIDGQATIASYYEAQRSNTWNLRPFYYMEDVPNIVGGIVCLGKDSIIKEVDERIDPTYEPDREWKYLRVSQYGIFLSEKFLGFEAPQLYKTEFYKIVRDGDLVYNPHRINVGSIGVVPSYLDNSLVSPAYYVFRSINKEYPPLYLMAVLKHPRYLRVIMNYCLGSTRASLPFSELSRIKIPKPQEDILNIIKKLDRDYDANISEAFSAREKVMKSVSKQIEVE